MSSGGPIALFIIAIISCRRLKDVLYACDDLDPARNLWSALCPQLPGSGVVAGILSSRTLQAHHVHSIQTQLNRSLPMPFPFIKIGRLSIHPTTLLPPQQIPLPINRTLRSIKSILLRLQALRDEWGQLRSVTLPSATLPPSPYKYSCTHAKGTQIRTNISPHFLPVENVASPFGMSSH